MDEKRVCLVDVVFSVLSHLVVRWEPCRPEGAPSGWTRESRGAQRSLLGLDLSAAARAVLFRVLLLILRQSQQMGGDVRAAKRTLNLDPRRLQGEKGRQAREMVTAEAQAARSCGPTGRRSRVAAAAAVIGALRPDSQTEGRRVSRRARAERWDKRADMQQLCRSRARK